VCILISTGASGDVFPGFSDGSHFIDLRFTATGSSQMAMGRIEFDIGKYIWLFPSFL